MLTASQKYGMIPQAEFVEREGRRVVEVIHGKDNLIHVEPDDFVISMRSFQGGLEWCHHSGSTSFHYVPVTPIKCVVPAFFAHLLKSERYISALRSTTNLIRDGQEIRYGNFVQVPLPVIPESEQLAIATILDRETAKIDALIAEQQRLIELLQEKRQAVISHAVTKGLNPDAPMKDSGVEWLGEVPEHWEVYRFKLSVDSCMNGVWGDEAVNDENDVACIRVADFDRQRLQVAELDEPTIRNVSTKDIEQRSLKPGDLLIEKSGGGEKQPVGAVVLFMIPIRAVCSNFVARMRIVQGMSPSFWRYVHHAAYSLRVNTKSIKQTSGIQNLDQQQYLNENAPFPPSEEQSAIATFLDLETTKIDALIAEQHRLIELLQERRSALISAAVTGQIDVRGLVPEASAA
jgi:type I restriction enzyme S subunit